MAQDTDLYKDLQHKLISNTFDHGEKLRAEQLKTEYNCSASTVREALFRLSTEGLVDFQEQRGFRVPQLSPELLAELTHVRILLESEGTVLSIDRGGVGWEARLTAAHHQLSHIETRIHAVDDPSGLVDIWFGAELEFHETLISACGSDTLKAIHLQVYRRFRQQLMVADRSFDFISTNIRHHHDIIVAALDGDHALTRQKIKDHLARHLDPSNRTQFPEYHKSSAM
ncbi:MAG: GntR family transcriptional regulator [Pseudomonadota bacterium]